MAKRNSRSSYGGSVHSYSTVRLPDLGSLFHANVKFLEDRRFYNPLRVPPPAAVQRSMRRQVVVPARSSFVPARIGFAVPKGVAVCVRRKERRSVIMAKGHGGGGKRRVPRRTPFSNVRC